MSYPGLLYPPFFPGPIQNPVEIPPRWVRPPAPDLTGWRYIATRLNGDGTETPLTYTLPIQGLKYREDLSGPGAISGTLSPEHANIPGGWFLPWRTGIYVEESGLIRAGAILNKRPTQGPNLNLDCVGFTGYPVGQQYRGVRSRIAVDAADEFRHIWDHVQEQDHKNLGLVWDDTDTGILVGDPEERFLTVLRGHADDLKALYRSFKAIWEADKTAAKKQKMDDAKADWEAGQQKVVDGLNTGAAEPYKLNWWSTDDLGAELDALASLGFDYRVDHAWDGEAITHKGTISTSIGARLEHRIVVGENIFEHPEIDYHGDLYATEVIVLGAGEGRDMKHGSAQRPTNHLGKTVTISDDSLTSNDACNQRARQELALRGGDPDISQIELLDHPHAPVGTIRPGDDIRVTTAAGWEDQLDIWVRVLAKEVTPETGRTVLDVTRVERVGASG